MATRGKDGSGWMLYFLFGFEIYRDQTRLMALEQILHYSSNSDEGEILGLCCESDNAQEYHSI